MLQEKTKEMIMFAGLFMSAFSLFLVSFILLEITLSKIILWVLLISSGGACLLYLFLFILIWKLELIKKQIAIIKTKKQKRENKQ